MGLFSGSKSSTGDTTTITETTQIQETSTVGDIGLSGQNAVDLAVAVGETQTELSSINAQVLNTGIGVFGAVNAEQTRAAENLGLNALSASVAFGEQQQDTVNNAFAASTLTSSQALETSENILDKVINAFTGATAQSIKSADESGTRTIQTQRELIEANRASTITATTSAGNIAQNALTSARDTIKSALAKPTSPPGLLLFGSIAAFMLYKARKS